jgi:predicted Zn-dependent protease
MTRLFDVKGLLAAFAPRRLPQNAFERAVVALERGEFEEALRALDSASGEAPGTVSRAAIENKRGVALVGLARRDEALAAFCAALEADEQHAPALVNLGNLLLEDGHPEDAVDYYEAALRADPHYALAYQNLGVACKRLGRRAESVRNLRVAARLESRRRPGRA